MVMSTDCKKLLFIGPAGVGKSTLKECFFHGQNPLLLLTQSLEPTIGKEISTFQFGKGDMGVFDLAGQELDRWLSGPEREETFGNADAIIAVFEVMANHRETWARMDRVLAARDACASSAVVFMLLHKIDLIPPTEIDNLRVKHEQHFKGRNVHVFFTSITSRYFMKTFDVFLTIINRCQSSISCSRHHQDAALKMIRLMQELYVNGERPVHELKRRLKEFDPNVDNTILQANQENLTEVQDVVLGLTSKGRAFMKETIETFRPFFLSARVPTMNSLEDHVDPLIKAVIVSDDNGRALLFFQRGKGIYEPSGGDLSKEPRATDGCEETTMELIPMFINALQKFSEEVNIKEMSEFRLGGLNSRVFSVMRDRITFTVFASPAFRIAFVRDQLVACFDTFRERFKDPIQTFLRTGNCSRLDGTVEYLQDAIEDILVEYIEKLGDEQYFDKEQAKEVYHTLNELQVECTSTGYVEKILEFKRRLVEAILNENMKDVQRIARDIEPLMPMLNAAPDMTF